MATSDLAEAKTPVSETQNPSTTANETAERISEQPNSNNHPPSSINSSESGAKRKWEEGEEEEAKDDDSKKTKVSSLHPLHKTSLCSYFRRNSGSCSHGEGCRFAHNEEELRPRPDGSWDPTSKRGKKEEKGDGEESDLDEEEERNVMMTEVLAESCDPQLNKCLLHLPRKWNSQQFKSFLDEQGIVTKTAKKKKGMTVGFLTFEVAEQVKSATESLIGKSVGNKTLKVGDVIPRSYDDKIQSAKNKNHNMIPGAADDNENGEEVNGSVSKGGLPCKLVGIIESPVINGYRNKCEFSVGYSVLQKPTVGFMLGTFREGVTAVEEPTNCPNVSKIASNYASVFQEFLQDSSLPIWNRFNNTGFWRQLTVREGRKPQKDVEIQIQEASIIEVMVVIQVSTKGYDDDLINSELQKLARAFVIGAASTSPPLPLTVLALQDHVGISNAAPADAPLRPFPIPTAQTSSETEVVTDNSEMRIHDYIGNLQFSISPSAFFQVNTLAAEKLYTLAGDWAGLGKDTLVFDVCCGTGTIGLTLANRVGMVIGIEMNASAVSDAQRNAEINGVTNCKFICGKAEDVMGSLLREYLDDSQEQDDTSNPSDNDQKQNVTAENATASVDTDLNPEIILTEAKVDPNHACGSIEEEQDLQINSITYESSPLSSKQHFKNVVAIVDPPRSGLHPIVIKALRTHPRLRRLVYISCNPETLVANAIELCTPLSEKNEKTGKIQGWRNMGNAGLARHRLKSMPKSEPFQPVKAMAVDLFPHTPHCELVMLLER